MKAILEFNLPEDNHQFEMATKGSDYYSVLWEIDQYLRANIKHAPDNMSEDTYNTFERCRRELRDIMGNYNVSID